ncbi:hypothetical protein QJS83_11170 [Bdellovibrio sp. 22V]|uniref:hypothetical protein n=1 Tax=Bdellovibrio TaxID=958 RepID=UPI002543C86D|nr:hypothetical protein [Bdellovibrio sp. 22V]WII71022.1 hypothetical protein QJS83_11170 [Bdellovibrio sp. 22V]
MNKEFQGNWQFPDQEILSQDVPVKLKNISLQMKTFLHKPALGNGQSVLELASKNLNAEIHMGEVSVDHVVERVVGGIIGRFRVHALCKDVVLTLSPGKGSFAMVVAPQLGSTQAGMAVQSVHLAWEPGSWTTPEIKCEGVEGFDDLLRQEITKIANDSQRFVEPQKELIKKYIQDSLKEFKFDFGGAKQLVAMRPDVRILMKIDNYQDTGEAGALVKGHLEIEFTQSKTEEVKILTLDATKAMPVSSEAQLRLPKEFAKEVLRMAYGANSWIHQVYSNKLPGFSALTGSRFAQFFVWPELMNYSKSAKFLFDVYSNKDVDIQGAGTNYQVKATFLSKMQAPRSGKYVPFMNFTLPFSSKVQIKVDGGKAQAYFANPSLGMTPQWDASYVKKYGPNRRFSTSKIRDKIVSGLWGKRVTVQLPQIPIAEDLSLSVKKLIAPADQDMLLQLAP